MTTAHRPTWHTALGGETQGGTRQIATRKVSGKDQPGNLTLKLRKAEQGGRGEEEQEEERSLEKNLSRKEQLKAQLEAKERKSLAERRKAESTLTALPANFDNPFPEDADDVDAPALPAVSSSDDEDDSDAEEEEALLRELNRIKKERMEEEKAKQAIEEKKRQAEQEEKMLRANPLLMQEGEGGGEGGFKTGGVKRRWDDEVVFRNQAKNPPKHTKQFINDPVRSEFHKKFLSKYIW